MIEFNHYEVMCKALNKNLPSNECSRCGDIETWKHVMQCRVTSDKNKEFIQETRDILKKVGKNDTQESVIDDIINDKETFLIGQKKKHMTNQCVIGQEQAFRGCVAKVQENQCSNWYFNKEISRVLVK